MKRKLTRLLSLALALFCLSACVIVVYHKATRWSLSLKCNGAEDHFECIDDTYPVEIEYSVPEFFIMDDGQVVFRFFYKKTGFKLQFANQGPFKYGKKYSYKAGDEYFDASFVWLYKGQQFECRSGSVEFKRPLLSASSIAYTVHFEFVLTAPGSNDMEIRNGVFTVYDKVNPRNTDLGLN